LITTAPEWLSTLSATGWIISGSNREFQRVLFRAIFKSLFPEKLGASDVQALWLLLKILKEQSRGRVSVLLVCRPLWVLLLDFYPKQLWNSYLILEHCPTAFPIMLKVTSSALTKLLLTPNANNPLASRIKPRKRTVNCLFLSIKLKGLRNRRKPLRIRRMNGASK
jgi:hypothetical protein